MTFSIRSLRRIGIVGGALALAATVAMPGAPAAAGSDSTALYIVQLADAPVAGYTGTVSGLPATKPAEGVKLDATTSNAQRYKAYLKSQHQKVESKASGVKEVYDYTTAFNGFAARMPASAAATLAHTAGVLNVSKNAMMQTDTVSTPA